MTKVSV